MSKNNDFEPQKNLMMTTPRQNSQSRESLNSDQASSVNRIKAKLADYLSQNSNRVSSSKERPVELKFSDRKSQETIKGIKMRNSARKMFDCLNKLDLSLPASTICDAFINLKRNSRAQASIVKSLTRPLASR